MTGESFADFVRQNEASFYRIAYSYVRNREDALDIVQDSIEKALSKLPGLRDESRIKPWFCRILVNESIDSLRRRRGAESVDESLPAPDETGKRAEALSLYAAVSKLPPKLKTVIVLRFFEDMKLQEVAEAAGCNLSTAKTRLYKALKLLRVELQDWEV